MAGTAAGHSRGPTEHPAPRAHHRSDRCRCGAISPDGLAGFHFDLRDLVTPLVWHTVVAQARDHDTGEWFDLNSTPRQLRCANDPAASPFSGVWTHD